jgi:ribosome assembly protein 1
VISRPQVRNHLIVLRRFANVIVKADVLGKVYGVVARRKGRIIAEEMKEGTTYFTVSSLLPVVESFGFADGKKCSSSQAPNRT